MKKKAEIFIKNEFKEYAVGLDFKPLLEKLIFLLNMKVNEFNEKIDPESSSDICSIESKSQNNFSVFDGAGGNLFIYLRLFEFSSQILKEENLRNAIENVLSKKEIEKNFSFKTYLSYAQQNYSSLDSLIKKSKVKERISFYFGPVGIYTLGCKLFKFSENKKKLEQSLQQILEINDIVMSSLPNKFYSEILYGKAGFLYCLLILQKECKCSFESQILEITKNIITEGIENFKNCYKVDFDMNNLPSDFRLQYFFHSKEYLGGAHGFFGILYILLTALENNGKYFEEKDPLFLNKFSKLIEKSVNFYIKFQYPSGNIASSFGSTTDKLVQFCHGSPGFVFGIIKYLEVYKNKLKIDELINIEKKLELAVSNIYEKGILKKGIGLCHGITGNAYAIYNYYKYSKDRKFLFWTINFALCSEDKLIQKEIANYDYSDRYLIGISDYPWSLMLGKAGEICLLIDIIENGEGRFPGFMI